MKNINEKLSDILEVEPIQFEEVQEQTKELIEVKSDSDVEIDTEIARRNIKDLIDKGDRAVEELAAVARDSQHPRAYEVLAGMIKNLSDMNKDLLEIQKRKKDLLVNIDKASKDVNIDKAVFVGSTAELMKLIKKG